MYNQFIVVGRLTRDGETQFLPSGAEVYKNSIASSKKIKSRNGEKKEKTMYMDFTCFNGLATTCKNYLHKGSLVLLSGEIELEQWTAQDGTNRSKHALRVDNMTMLDSRSDTQSYSQHQQNDNQPQTKNMQEPPQGGGEYIDNRGLRQSNIPEIDIDDSETIPF